MSPITTKRHPLKFYALLAFGFLFLFALGTLLVFLTIDTFQKEVLKPKEYLLPLFSLAIYFMAFLMVYSYWKNSPTITVDNNNIKFGTQNFYLKDIKDISLTGKQTFRYLITFPMEGAAILFKDGTEKIIFDDMYSNSWEIKSFLEQVVVKKQEYQPSTSRPIDSGPIYLTSEQTFKGNPFTSFRGISLWGIIGFFAYLILTKYETPPLSLITFFSAFGLFWFVLHSWLMHYFVLTNDYLIIKNHNYFWMSRIYQLTDIKEIVYETQGKQPNCMRVITTNFRNKLYPAGTLRDKTWLALQEQLESKGITVRNECIFI